VFQLFCWHVMLTGPLVCTLIAISPAPLQYVWLCALRQPGGAAHSKAICTEEVSKGLRIHDLPVTVIGWFGVHGRPVLNHALMLGLSALNRGFIAPACLARSVPCMIG
jgi:hypothetical protein